MTSQPETQSISVHPATSSGSHCVIFGTRRLNSLDVSSLPKIQAPRSCATRLMNEFVHWTEPGYGVNYVNWQNTVRRRDGYSEASRSLYGRKRSFALVIRQQRGNTAVEAFENRCPRHCNGLLGSAPRLTRHHRVTGALLLPTTKRECFATEGSITSSGRICAFRASANYSPDVAVERRERHEGSVDTKRAHDDGDGQTQGCT